MDNKETPPLSRWLITWLRDYTFWRDILSTMIGGVLVLVVAYLWAESLGLVTSPGFWQSVGTFFGAIGLPILIPLIGVLVSVVSAWYAGKKGLRQDDWFGQELEETFRTPRRSRDEGNEQEI